MYMGILKKTFLFLILIQLSNISCQNKIDIVKLDIDLSEKIANINSMSGFLHYKDIRALDRDIKALKPKYWRIGWSYNSIDEVNYLKQNNIMPIMVVSDKYGYPYETHKNWESPLESDKFRKFLTNLYQEMGNSVIYDIWNESSFSDQEFHLIFKQAHDIIRSQPGGDRALIAGPSYAKYDRTEIESFLKYCLANNIRLDVLSWHDWRSGKHLPELKKDINYVKADLLQKYSKVGVKNIILTEVVFADIQFNPSEILNLLHALEDSGIDGACKACWEESNGLSNCNNNSMDGILDDKGNPRSAWWAYKLYGQSLENRVNVTSSYDMLIPFVSYDSNNIYLLVANNGLPEISKLTVSVKNIFKNVNFKDSKQFTLKFYEIIDTQEKALKEPNLIYSKNVKLNSKNILTLDFDQINSKQVYYFVISKK